MSSRSRITRRAREAHSTANGQSRISEPASRTTHSRTPSSRTVESCITASACSHATDDYPDISIPLPHADSINRGFPHLERSVERACYLLRMAGGSPNVRAASALARALESMKSLLVIGKILVPRNDRHRRRSAG